MLARKLMEGATRVDALELDPALNRLPPHPASVHLIGICGTAMGALAGMLKKRGFSVTGSDANVYPPMSDFLAEMNIPVRQGYAPDNLAHNPDLVVVGNVVTRQNPEAAALADRGLCYLSLPQTLYHLFLKNKNPLVVTGTHGKTTTAALAAWLLEAAGADPGFLIGGILKNFGSNHRLGGGDWFVVEGDEYDTAFFDKGPKFLHYAPRIAVLTSLEFDHADIFPSLNEIRQAFRALVGLLLATGLLVACGDDPEVKTLAAEAPCPVRLYGLKHENAWRAVDLTPSGRETRFRLLRPGRPPLDLTTPLAGAHNVANTLAALAALDGIGLEAERLAEPLTRFQGVKRRQEVRGVHAGVTVLDDFAHHPTAVRETLAAIRGAYPARRLVAVFEPRTNTSRRNVFQHDYAAAFDHADLVLIREAPGLEKIPPGERFSSAQLVKDLNARGRSAFYFPDTDRLLADLAGRLQSGDVVLIMSNGGFDGLHERLLADLAQRDKGQAGEAAPLPR
jgi:UDP-N-acetylmuramate: L-alanyl-gamma-D-glutamyl-meso-diaminopimelate ligase